MLSTIATLAALAAPTDAARVVSLRGDVSVQHRHDGASSGPASVGATLHQGDTIRTGPESTARVNILGDRGTIDLGPRASFEMKAYNGEPRAGGLVQLKLLAGRVWAAITGGRGEFQVVTDNGVAGVRGTQFAVEVTDSGAMQVTVLEGSVEVGATGAAPRLLEPMQRGTLSPDGSLSVETVTQQQVMALAPQLAPSGDSSPIGNEMEAPSEQVADGDKLEASRSAVASMKAILAKVLKHLSDARDEGDVVKLNCVNEKLTAIKGLLKIAEQSDVLLQEALARRDTESAQHEFEKISIAKRKCDQLLGESEACVGELAVYAGDTEVALELDESVPEQDPTEYIPPPVVVERPPTASPFQ